MAMVGVINDFPEVVVAIARLLTPGHDVNCLTFSDGFDSLEANLPDVLVAILFRHPEAFDRPITDFECDVSGGALLRKLNESPALSRVPLILFGIGIDSCDVPEDLHYHSYLTFPQAIQELNPLISAIIGPAPQQEGGRR